MSAPFSKNSAEESTSSGFSLEEIKRLLECVVCTEVILPPAHHCRKGHLLCELCQEKLSECPVCRSELGSIRCLVADSVADIVPVQCTFKRYGCRKEVAYKEKVRHEVSCSFRPVRCPNLRCQEMLPMHQLLEHFQNIDHKSVPSKNSNFTGRFIAKDSYFTLTGKFIVNDYDMNHEQKLNPTWLSCFDRHFFLQFWRKTCGYWYLWVWFIGSQEESKQFLCEITVCHENISFHYKGYVYSLQVSETDIANSGCCLTFSDKAAKSLCRADTEGDYCIAYQLSIGRI